MATEKVAPIIVIRRVRKAAHGHHGGAWKVAYADFVTAMMAFFLVMWLVGSTTREQRAAISQYFKNPSMVEGASPVPSPGIMGPGGASNSMIKLGGAMDLPHPQGQPHAVPGPAHAGSVQMSVRTAEQITHEADKQRLESLMRKLKTAIDQSRVLRPFKDQLLIDITPEGLRIQIVDKENRSMFDLGSAKLKSYTRVILNDLAPFLNTVPNKISITGHTDERPYGAGNDYTNWELSADRANAARRALVEGGLDHGKVARVVGLGSTVLFDKGNPLDPINRRISIIVMNANAEERAEHSEQGASLSPPADVHPLETPPDAARPMPVSPGTSRIGAPR